MRELVCDLTPSLSHVLISLRIFHPHTHRQWAQIIKSIFLRTCDGSTLVNLQELVSD